MIRFKGAHFEKAIILTCVRWYVVYPLSNRQLEELTQERGVSVDHSTINRWVVAYRPQVAAAFQRRKRPVGASWRMDEMYIRVKGQWCSRYRAVDHAGQTIDFLWKAGPHRAASPQKMATAPYFATSVQGITASVVSARRGGRRSATCEKMTSGVDRVAARSTTSRKERTPCNTC